MSLSNLTTILSRMKSDDPLTESVTPNTDTNTAENDDIETLDIIDDTAEIDAAQSSDEANDSIDAAIDSENTAEMFAERLLELQSYLDYVDRNGVNSTFLAIANRNDQLAKLLNMQIPACESFGTSGNRYHPIVTDMVAGLENIIKDIWEWIKNLATRVWDSIRTFIRNILDYFNSAEKIIKKLREAVSKFEPHVSPAHPHSIKSVRPEQFAELVKFIKNKWRQDFSNRNAELDEKKIYTTYIKTAKEERVSVSVYNREEILKHLTVLENLLTEANTLKKQAESLQKDARQQVDDATKNAQKATNTENKEANKEAAEKAKEQASNLNVLMRNQKVFANVLMRVVRLGLAVPKAWVKDASRGTRISDSTKFGMKVDESIRRFAEDINNMQKKQRGQAEKYWREMPDREYWEKQRKEHEEFMKEVEKNFGSGTQDDSAKNSSGNKS